MSANQPVAYLADPKPGKFRFRVRAANEHGVWNESGIALDLDVQPFSLANLVVPHDIDSGAGRRRGGRQDSGSRGFGCGRQFERLGQQKALQHEQARLASVLEATSDFVAFADLDGNLLYLNRAAAGYWI